MWHILAEILISILGAVVGVLDFVVKTALAAVVVLIVAKLYFKDFERLQISVGDADDEDDDPANQYAVETLKICRDVFRRYEKIHREKSQSGADASRDAKAVENGIYADRCERALNALGVVESEDSDA
jgi:hypothetical protein